jgi:ribosome-associated heat shock protein Hsp15
MGLLSWPKGRRVYQDSERLEYLLTTEPRSCVRCHKKLMPPVLKPPPDNSPDTSLRLDRWLVQARFFKTRALASRAVAGGHVRRNRERARPGSKVTIGDRLEIVRGHERYEIEVRALPPRRGPASEARTCYVESQQSIEDREATKARIRVDRMTMPRTPGRPDKHTRRLLRQRNRSAD